MPPVVRTSSTRVAVPPRHPAEGPETAGGGNPQAGLTPVDSIEGGAASLASRLRPRWLPRPRRTSRSSANVNPESARTISRASSPAGSKPRHRFRPGAAGTGTRICPHGPDPTRSAMYPAINGARPVSPRNLKAASRARATPSCGAQLTTSEIPGGGDLRITGARFSSPTQSAQSGSARPQPERHTTHIGGVSNPARPSGGIRPN